VRDAALIAGAQKVEHYEISAYGTLAYMAGLLQQGRAKDLLGETLNEEKAADEKLNQIAMSDVNREALLGSGNGQDGEDEEENGTGRSKRPARGRSSGTRRHTGRQRTRKRR
jgi:hypothetical protein